jgi:hypothetical protein
MKQVRQRVRVDEIVDDNDLVVCAPLVDGAQETASHPSESIDRRRSAIPVGISPRSRRGRLR